MSERIPLNDLQAWEYTRINAVLAGKVWDAVPPDHTPSEWVLLGEASGGAVAEKTRKHKEVISTYHVYVQDTAEARGWKRCCEMMALVATAVSPVELTPITLTNDFEIVNGATRIEGWEKLPQVSEGGSTVRHGIVRVRFLIKDTT